MGNVKFAIMTDLHNEHIPDGFQRLENFIQRARQEEVDFIIQLGDFCYPVECNNKLLSLFNNYEKPHYHLIGNHDIDRYSKKEMIKWLGMDNDYYSFDCNGIRFLVIDANYFKYDGKVEQYNKRNHKAFNGDYPFIPEEEMLWIKNTISDSELPIVIFSHQSLENTFQNRGIANRTKIQDLIHNETLNGKKILACMNGHDHTDSVEKINKTYYYTVNSIAYKWLGFETLPAFYEIRRRQPQLKDIILNEAALSAIITINENNNIEIRGMRGRYKDFLPEDVGIAMWDGRRVTADIQSRKLNFESIP